VKNNRARNLVSCAVFCAAVSVLPLAAQPRLEYVVIVTRHGVRSPTWERTRLNEYSTAPWPEWPVPPGYLTPHGRAAVRLLGSYYRERFLRDRLFAGTGCADAKGVYIWADTDQRTLETGRALSESLLPGCDAPTHSRPAGEKDPLFAGLSEYDPSLAAEAVRARLGTDVRKVVAEQKPATDTLQFVLDGGQARANKLIGALGDVGVSLKGATVELQGPFAVGSTLSEDLLLEYAEGLRGTDLGWGRLTKENLARVLGLHGVYTDLMRRTPYLARVRGSNLLFHILRSLEQAASRTQMVGALGQPGDKLLVLSGHDTNLSNLSGMLDLSWSLPGYQKDETPPGGALLFSLWKEGDRTFVTTEYVAQSLDQMRALSPLAPGEPPLRQDVRVPACGGGKDCAWRTFQIVLEKGIDLRFTDAK
jgi:4-phytase / acid phosphatase